MTSPPPPPSRPRPEDGTTTRRRRSGGLRLRRRLAFILLSSAITSTSATAATTVAFVHPGVSSTEGQRQTRTTRGGMTTTTLLFAAPSSPPTSSSRRGSQSAVRDGAGGVFPVETTTTTTAAAAAGASTGNRNSIVDQLRSLSSVISRTRTRELREAGGGENNRRRRKGATAGSSGTLPHRRALLRTLSLSLRSPAAIPPDDDDGTVDPLRGALTDACVQAIRAAGDEGDYVYVGKLLDAAVSFSLSLRLGSDDCGASARGGVLEPRVFGEAVDALSRTSAGPAKIRRAWRLLLDSAGPGRADDGAGGGEGGVLAAPPGAHELNAYLTALASRGKIRAALDAYRDHATAPVGGGGGGGGGGGDGKVLAIEADGYTYSALLNALADSVEDADDRGGGEGERDGSRWHWQWEEALVLLDSAAAADADGASERHHLNNHVYAAALKLNDGIAAADAVATSSGRDGDHVHDGAAEALGMLRRMQRDGVSPNVVTCTMVLSACDRGRRWKEATALLGLMRKQQRGQQESEGGGEASIDGEKDRGGGDARWTLPAPNAYSYAAAASACARCNRVGEAMSILDDAGNDPGGANAYVYNSAMSALVGSDVPPAARVSAVLGLLDRMESHSDDSGAATVAPNTVTYNTALAALTMTGSSAEVGGAEADMLVDGPKSVASMEAVVPELLGRMRRDGIPADSVTYRNAILACGRSGVDATAPILETALDRLPRPGGGDDRQLREVCNAALSVCANCCTKGDSGGRCAVRIFRDMIRRDIEPDSTTLFYMIKSLGSNRSDCLAATEFLHALRERADANDYLREKFDIDLHAIVTVDDGGRERPRIGASKVLLEERHYVAAITSCLKSDAVKVAIRILGDMRADGISPTQSTYKSIIYACCTSATGAAKVEHRISLKRRWREEIEVEDFFGTTTTTPKKRSHKIESSSSSAAAPRARAAVTLLRAVTDPDPALLSAVSRACAASDMWVDALRILRELHGSAIGGVGIDAADPGPSRNQRVMIALPKLHRSLLSICARGGNVTAALAVADEVQRLEGELTRLSANNTDLSFATNGLEVDEPPCLSSLLSFGGDVNASNTDVSPAVAESSQLKKMIATQSTSTAVGIGMGDEEWKLVMIASSKARDWRVCLGTLQFLRPFVEETHPAGCNPNRTVEEAAAGGVNRGTLGQPVHLGSSEGGKRRRHASLSDALTSALLCLEACGHYAWAIRAIYDWIEWSGRRPGRQAVVAASRVLAARGQGGRVADLVSRAIAVPRESGVDGDGIDQMHLAEEVVYERDLYGQSITALYKSGDYKSADELYATAVEGGYLPWAVAQYDEGGVVERDAASDRAILSSGITSSEPAEHGTLHRNSDEHEPLVLDLHGMTTAIAHSAVRTALWKEIQLSEQQPHQVNDGTEGTRVWTRDVIIVTGRGMNSAERLRPVLRPEVQRMLLEEFYPPLGTASVAGNMGALRVPAADVDAWLAFHREQRGVRMLLLADVLRKISSGSRLKQGITKLAGGKR